MPSALKSPFRLGDCVVDVDRSTIVRGDREVTLEPKTMMVLSALAERPGAVLSAEELIELVWEGRILGDNPVYGAVAKLRRALGDDARSPRYVETVARRGYRLALSPEEMAPSDPQDQPLGLESKAPTRFWSGGRLAGSLIAFALLLALATWGFLARGPKGVDVADADPKDRPASIAVLPFGNVSGDPEFDAFGVGFSEDVLNTLARIEGLRVIARASAFGVSRDGPEIPELARTLDVGYVLNGTVHPEGETLRVSVRLLDSMGQQLWGESYDRPLERTLDVRMEVAEAIARKLSLTLAQQDRADRPAPSVGALQSFLAGREATWLGLLEHADKAIRAYRRAIELEPEYADAHAGLARVYVHERRRDEALHHAERALELSPHAAEAHVALGLLVFRSRSPDRLERAEQHFRRAVELNPSLSEARHYLAMTLVASGRWTDALRARELALERDPLHYGLNRAVARSLADRGELDRALESIERALEGPHPDLPAMEDLVLILWNWSRHAELIGRIQPLLPSLPDALHIDGHSVLASSFGRLDLDEPAATAYQRAREDPSWPGQGVAVVLRFDYLWGADRPDLVVAELESLKGTGSRQLADFFAGMASIRAGRFREGAEVLDTHFVDGFAYVGDVAALDAMQFLSLANASLGEREKADRRLRQLLDSYRRLEQEGFAEDPFHLSTFARIHALLGESESSIRYLEAALARGWVGHVELRNDPRWDSLRDHPSFPLLLERALEIVERQREQLLAVQDTGDRLSAEP